MLTSCDWDYLSTYLNHICRLFNFRWNYNFRLIFSVYLRLLFCSMMLSSTVSYAALYKSYIVTLWLIVFVLKTENFSARLSYNYNSFWLFCLNVVVVQWDLHAVLLCFTIQPVYHETTAIPFSAFYAADLFSHVARLGVVTNRGLVLIDKILSP